MKVLHIDDSPQICDLYKDMFTADDHSVRSINSGKKGPRNPTTDTRPGTCPGGGMCSRRTRSCLEEGVSVRGQQF